MEVDAADLVRRALEGSAVISGYKLTLERLKVHSMGFEAMLWWGHQREVRSEVRRECLSRRARPMTPLIAIKR